MGTRKSTPKVVRRHMALFDVHVPHNIDLTPVLKFAQHYKPTDFIIGGDYLNLEWASHWNEKEFKQIGLEKISRMLEEELLSGQKVLDQISTALKGIDCKKYYIPGNHEEWIYWACLNYPGLAGSLSLGVERMTFKSDLARIRKQVVTELITKFLDVNKYGFDVLEYEKELVLNHITYIHGHQVRTPAAMRRKYPARNMICGHHHTHMTESLHNSGDQKETKQYVFVPCLCKLSPGYLKDGSTRWTNGFWVADILSNGNFSGHVVKVEDGYTAYDGKVY